MEKECVTVIAELNSSNNSIRYGALIMLRTTLIKSKEAVNKLIQDGCVEILVTILKDGNSQANSTKTLDIVLSILANLCLEDDVREKVVSCDGVSAIAEVVMTSEQESIQNRGVRAIANLVQHLPIRDVIFQLELPTFVAKRLREVESNESVSTFLRLLRILASSNENIKRLVEESTGTSAIASVLKRDSKKLVFKSLQALYEMSSMRCCAAFAEEILAANILEEMVVLAEDSDKQTAYYALSVILRLADHDTLRPPLGNAGFIDLLMREIKHNESHVVCVSILNALCLCSRESVNRQKLYIAESLEFFMSCLDLSEEAESSRTMDYSLLHDRLISSLINFVYDDKWMSRLLDLNLINILVRHLFRVCDIEVHCGDLDKDINILASLPAHTTDNNVNDNCNQRDQNERMDESESPPCRVEGTDKTLEDQAVASNSSPDKEAEASEENPRMISDPLQINEIQSQDPLDEEVKDIVSGSSDLDPPKRVFSINSPTYQLGQSSWSLEAYSSGATCKKFGSENSGQITTPPHASISPNENQDLAPYSPLSGGASYYSPSYSPSYSLGSSPKYSPNPHASLFSNAGGLGMSPQGSPTWSLATSSSQQSPFDQSPNHNSPLGSSPSSSLQAPFSPLSITFPTSPSQSQPSQNEESQSPVFNSQMSLMSQSVESAVASSEFSQENIGSADSNTPFERMSPSFREVSLGGNGAHQFSVVPLSQEEELIYSASEEDGEEEQTVEVDGDSKTANEPQESSNLNEMLDNPQDKSLSHKSSATTSFDHQRPGSLKRSHSSPSSSSNVHSEADIKEICLESPDRYSKKIKLNESVATSVDDLMEKNRKLSIKSAINDSSQKQNSVSQGSINENRDDRLVSHPFYKTWWKQPSTISSQRFPHSPLGSLSPSSSSSPWLSHGLSPLASPKSSRSPYHHHDTGLHHSAGEGSDYQRVKHASLSPANRRIDLNDNASSSSRRIVRHQQNRITNPTRASASSFSTNTRSHSSDRLKKILRTSESNIMILLSRVSIKSNPSQHLLQSKVFSSLLSYLSQASNPLQRCFRLLKRICTNSLCFPSLLLVQGPALIVRYLIQELDGSFPSILFETEPPGSSNQHRLINLDDIVPSSQNSDTASSQASEFGQKMEFEFGSDAYSQMMTMTSRSSTAALFRSLPSLSHDSQSAQDGSAAQGGSIYDSNSNRKKVQIQIGMRLLRFVTSLALSRYGDGEVRHILARGSKQEKLQCVISLLHLLFACGSFSRHQLLSKARFEEVIPFLFIPDAPMARTAIVTAISLYAHVIGFSKTVDKQPHTFPCADICDAEEYHTHETKKKCPVKGRSKSCLQKGNYNVKDSLPQTSTITNGNLKSICGASNPMNNCVSSCVYTALSPEFDISLIIINENLKEVFKARKETLMGKSVYFSNMLGGNYKEADKDEVTLRNISISGFEYVIHYLHGCVPGCTVIDSIPAEIKRVDSRTMQTPRIGNARSGNKNNYAPPNSENVYNVDNKDTVDNVCDTNSLSSKDRPASCSTSSTSNTISGGCPSDDIQVRVGSISTCSDSRSAAPIASSDPSTSSSSTFPTAPLDGPLDESTHHSSSKDFTSEGSDPDEIHWRNIDGVLDRCDEVLAVADQFVVKDLVNHVIYVLSHQCLYPHTCEFIFSLACFYKFDNLIFDCVAQMVLSSIPRSEVSEFILRMADGGYREHVESVLTRLTRVPS